MLLIIVYILIVLLCFYTIYQILGDAHLYPKDKVYRFLVLPLIIVASNILTFSVINIYFLISSMNQ